jgi:NTP pyrophosphatase (non-canonical NTP hydrolase)
MLHLAQNPTLKDFQDYVVRLEKERGFTDNTVIQNALMLGEEVGELFKAIRKVEKMKVDDNSHTYYVGEEMADILIYLCSLANRMNIDLEQAFRNKEEINKKRIWKKG